MSEPARHIRVLVVDDHAVVRRGLRMFLGDDPEIELVARRRTARRRSGWPESCCRMWP